MVLVVGAGSGSDGHADDGGRWRWRLTCFLAGFFISCAYFCCCLLVCLCSSVYLDDGIVFVVRCHLNSAADVGLGVGGQYVFSVVGGFFVVTVCKLLVVLSFLVAITVVLLCAHLYVYVCAYP